MVSEKFFSLSDDLIARYLEGCASKIEIESIYSAIVSSSDLWVLRNMVQSLSDKN